MADDGRKRFLEYLENLDRAMIPRKVPPAEIHPYRKTFSEVEDINHKAGSLSIAKTSSNAYKVWFSLSASQKRITAICSQIWSSKAVV